MDAPKYGWLSARRQLRLVTGVQHHLDRWLADWSLRAASCSVDIEPADSPQGWNLGLSRGEAILGLAVSNDVLARLGAHLAMVDDSADTLLARDLGMEAMRDLGARLLSTEDSGQLRQLEPASLDGRTFAASFGAAVLGIAIDGIEVRVALNRQAVDGLSPAEPITTPSALTAREAALANNEVDLDLVLPLGDFNLEEVLGLACGDVLVSEMPLDTAFDFTAGGQSLGLRCRLARVGETKAAFVEACEVTP